jgi:Translocon-associated protein (TRAP), alpha subunit
MCRKSLLLALLACHCLLGRLSLVRAEEDEVEEEEDEGVVEEEGGAGGAEAAGSEDEEAATDGKTTTSADADTTILFTRPPGTSNLGKKSIPEKNLGHFL